MLWEQDEARCKPSRHRKRQPVLDHAGGQPCSGVALWGPNGSEGRGSSFCYTKEQGTVGSGGAQPERTGAQSGAGFLVKGCRFQLEAKSEFPRSTGRNGERHCHS